jgi:hypothetical protein
MADRYYAYHGSCLHCDSTFLIETNLNYGKEHTILCPICGNGVGDIDLVRVGMGKKDENTDYTISVKGSGKRAVTPTKEHSSN